MQLRLARPGRSAGPWRFSRRDVLCAAAQLAACGALSACGVALPSTPAPTPSRRARRVAYLSTTATGPGPNTLFEAFEASLGEAGYRLGDDLILEYRSAEGDVQRLPGLVDELLREPVDVLVTSATPAAQAANTATNTTQWSSSM
jgi:ABC-type uncharacterized transport system substrate-binding protein